MPLNALLAAYLLEFRDQQESDSNLYRTYNKAYNSIRKYEQDIHSVEQAGHVYGIGKTILRMLTNRMEKERGGASGAVPGPARPIPKSYVDAEALIGNPFFDPSMLNVLGDMDGPPPATSRGRGRGRPRGSSGIAGGSGRGRGKRARAEDALGDNVIEGSPPKKRSPEKASEGPAGVPMDDPDAWAVPAAASAPTFPPKSVTSGEAHFWYLDTGNARVAHYDHAEIHIHAPFVLRKVELPIAPSVPAPLPSPFKLIFLEGQPRWTKVHSRVAWVEEEWLLEKRWHFCVGFEDVVQAPSRVDPRTRGTASAAPAPVKLAQKPALLKDDLASLLAQEARNKIKTLDPSRTGRSRTEAAPQPLARTPSSDGPEFFSDPVDVRRSAADAAVRRQQAAQATNIGVAAPRSQSKDNEKVPSRTTSTTLPRMPASVSSSVPPRASTVPLFATRRVSTGNLSFPIFQPTVISANTYDIILLLDNREIGRYGNRDALRDGLEKLKVPVEQRALAVGDTVWIARSRENERECVLNWIVERKRLDDLCASIKDSRFQDQKHRLYQSGLTHVFYLVEHFAVQRLMSSHRLMINTALSRTQVVDEFQVKETSSQQETIEFLANMHLAIQTILTGQSLYVLPSSALSRPTYMAFQAHLRESEPDIEYLPSWSDFQNLNGKNATRTVGETWARMQLCIKGLSAERVSKLLEHYRTPRELWEAYCEAENIEALAAQSAGDVTPGKGKGKKKASGPKTMLSELGGEGRRKITDAMSQKVQEILMSRTYL